jgi:hypothetical protein
MQQKRNWSETSFVFERLLARTALAPGSVTSAATALLLTRLASLLATVNSSHRVDILTPSKFLKNKLINPPRKKYY